MKTSLVIMAAGIGSRFGGGIKQLEPIGPGGEIIMDYSIYDARAAGFNKVVFIIRRDIEEDFRSVIGKRIEQSGIEVAYAYQELSDIPDSYKGRWDRVKPWGTAHALLVAKDVINEPFAVINADDYYGKEAFKKVHDYLVNDMDGEAYPLDLCMAAFELINTLSEHGGVTRGVCSIENSYMTDIKETYEIKLEGEKISAKDFYGNDRDVPVDSYVSMNMWGLNPKFLECLESGFEEFLSKLSNEDIKSEYLLPTVIDNLIKSENAKVSILKTPDKWFGVTYKEDKKLMVQAVKELIAKGMYEDIR